MASGPVLSDAPSPPAWRLLGLDVALQWRPEDAVYAASVESLPDYSATGATRTEALKALADRLESSFLCG